MKKTIAAAVLVLLATACGAPTPAPQPAPPPTRYVPPPIVQQTPRPRPPREDRSDLCGAKPLQGLIGKPRTDIPVPVDPTNRRVTCTSCPVTQDYRPDRLNIFYDAETGIIREVKCG